MQQLLLFEEPVPATDLTVQSLPEALIDLAVYDHIIVFLSGGKDSIACVLHLLDAGAPHERIELWHHDVDGREGSHLMDWPCTPT